MPESSGSIYRTAAFACWRVSVRTSESRIAARDARAAHEESSALHEALRQLDDLLSEDLDLTLVRRAFADVCLHAAQATEHEARAESALARARAAELRAPSKHDPAAFSLAAAEHSVAHEEGLGAKRAMVRAIDAGREVGRHAEKVLVGVETMPYEGRNARLTPAGRRLVRERIDAGSPVAHVAAAMGISCRRLGGRTPSSTSLVLVASRVYATSPGWQ